MTLTEYEETHWRETGSYPAQDVPTLAAARACCGLCVRWWKECEATLARLEEDE